jgi:hypothetical protein
MIMMERFLRGPLKHRRLRRRLWEDDGLPLIGIRDWPGTRHAGMAYGGTPPTLMVRKLVHADANGRRLVVATYRQAPPDTNRLAAALLRTLRHGDVPIADAIVASWSELPIEVDDRAVVFSVSPFNAQNWAAVGNVEGTFCSLLCDGIAPAAILLTRLDPRRVPLQGHSGQIDGSG